MGETKERRCSGTRWATGQWFRFGLGLLVLGVGLALAAGAEAQTQASGSILVEPDKGQSCTPPVTAADDVLSSGETLDIDVSIFNTSTTAGVSVTATVSGTTLIRLSCTDATCGTELQALTFDSCTTTAGVASCATDGGNPNHVLITYTGGGKTLAANTTTLLVTIHAHATPAQQVTSSVCGGFVARGDTGANDINNTSGGITGGAQGSAPLFYPGFCGDGVVEAILGETCDPADTVTGAGCRAAGTTNQCTKCGDGIIQASSGETCDGAAGGPGCRTDCTKCGDGIIQAAHGETCDGAAGGPGCRADCTKCGDGIVQAADGETCDGSPGCRADCTFCGDGVVQAQDGEQCEPPNSVGCSATCQIEQLCDLKVLSFTYATKPVPVANKAACEHFDAEVDTTCADVMIFEVGGRVKTDPPSNALFEGAAPETSSPVVFPVAGRVGFLIVEGGSTPPGSLLFPFFTTEAGKFTFITIKSNIFGALYGYATVVDTAVGLFWSYSTQFYNNDHSFEPDFSEITTRDSNSENEVTWFPVSVVATSWYVLPLGPKSDMAPPGGSPGIRRGVGADGGAFDLDENFFSGAKNTPVRCLGFITRSDVLQPAVVASTDGGGQAEITGVSTPTSFTDPFDPNQTYRPGPFLLLRIQSSSALEKPITTIHQEPDEDPGFDPTPGG